MANDAQGTARTPDPAAEKVAAAAGSAGAAAQEDPAAQDAPRFNAAGWRDRARMALGVSPHAIAGALYGIEPDVELSEQQVRDRLDEFSTREAV